ncbi:MAG: NAD-dependent epimerase [Pseudosphingobacterium sp.]|nr:NAD-dependent epimerase [Olivibacter sp. UJ_SKK_5.1]MDX3912679.1 NAD-dependent epimerase [Pseudosphingobacterium sp.]
MARKILVTGTAGFIGFHLAEALLQQGNTVIGIDNINDYYSPELKYARLRESGIAREEIVWYKKAYSSKHPNYMFIRMNLEDKQQLFSLMQDEQFDAVVNLAAQAGVRYSLENPDVYIQSNIVGFHNLLEAIKNFPVKHLVHASSSSVYGANAKIPFSEEDKVDNPVSLYAATKKSNELMAHCYSYLYKIPVTCLRFFTVYGPWGRPDMAPMLFAKAIMNDTPIKVFNEGDMQRDFTYVADIVEGIIRTIAQSPKSGDSTPSPYRVLNIGNGSPVNLMEFIEALESALGKKALKNFMEMQPGDVKRTWADSSKLEEVTGYRTTFDIKTGVESFAEWFMTYSLKSILI